MRFWRNLSGRAPLRKTGCGFSIGADSDSFAQFRNRYAVRAQTKKPSLVRAGLAGGCKSLTMTYFHTGTRTIIGAEAFHCPVRDGKEWDHLAMVIRHNRMPGRCETSRPIRRVAAAWVFTH